MVITSFNFDTDELERSFLALAPAAGVTTLTTKNNDRFAANDRVLVGEMGREKSEILTVTAVPADGVSLTVSATVFPHSADDPVYQLRFDQVRFYRSTTGSDGTYTLVSTQALDVDNENLTTIYDDTAGLANYYYKIAYYHSVTTLESTLSDPVAGSGYPRGTVGFLIDEVLRELADPEARFVSRPEILGWLNEVNDDLTTRRHRPYGFLHTRAAYTRTAGAATLPFPIDMLKHDRLETVFTTSTGSTTTYPVRVISLPEYRNNYGDGSGGDANDELQLIALDQARGLYRLWPRSKTSTPDAFYLYYWKTFTELDSEADVLETPTPRVYKLFVLYKFYLKKSLSDSTQAASARDYYALYNTETMALGRLDRVDAGSPLGFQYQPQTYKGNRRF